MKKEELIELSKEIEENDKQAIILKNEANILFDSIKCDIANILYCISDSYGNINFKNGDEKITISIKKEIKKQTKLIPFVSTQFLDDDDIKFDIPEENK